MEWYIFALISALLVSAQSILEKKSLYRTHSLDLATALSIFNFIFILLLFNKVNFNLSFNTISLIYIASLVSTFAFWFAAKAIHHFNITTSISLLALSPAITVILAFFFLNESLTYFQFFGIGLMVLGTYVLKIEKNIPSLDPFRKIIKSRYGVYILLALIFYGISSLYDKFILSSANVSPITYIFYLHFFTMINFIILMNLLHDGLKGIVSCTKKVGLNIIIILSLLITASRVSYAYAVPLAYISLVYAIVKSSSFFTTIIGGEIFHEKRIIKKSIASLIILIGVYLIII